MIRSKLFIGRRQLGDELLESIQTLRDYQRAFLLRGLPQLTIGRRIVPVVQISPDSTLGPERLSPERLSLRRRPGSSFNAEPFKPT